MLPTAAFPPTRDSVIAAIGGDDTEARVRALGAVATAYWKPAYTYLRLRWRLDREDAEDLTQELFARAAERGTFARYDPAIARFRTFVRACLDSEARNARTAASRKKRGGGATHLPLDADFARAEGELVGVQPPDDDDEFFRREWLRHVFELAVDDLRARLTTTGRLARWTVFERHDLSGGPGAERPSYAQLARELQLPVTQVTNYLAAARRELRALVLSRLRELCATDTEFRDEARELLGRALE